MTTEPTPAEIAAVFARAQEALAGAVEKGHLRQDDPLTHVLTGMSAVVAALEVGARQPVLLSPPQEADLVARVSTTAARAVRAEVPGIYRAFSRRTSVMAGIGVVLGALVGGLGGYALGKSTSPQAVSWVYPEQQQPRR